MKGLLIIMFLFTVTLFFLLILQRFSSKNKLTETRVNRYLGSVTEVEKAAVQVPKKFQRTMQLRFVKQTVKKYLAKKDKTAHIETLLSQAGVPLKPEEYIMFKWISIALGAGILNLIVGNLIVIPLGAYIGSVIPKMILKRRQRVRLKKFNDALPEMISTIVGALRAGFSFPQALKSVAEESSSPMKEEMEWVLKEMQYGVTIEDSLNKLKEQMPSEDLNLMVQAILIQRQVGGNLATVLDQIANTIRERIKIQGQIKTLTAQGRLSGMVVALLPVILGGLLFVIEPDYITVLFTNTIGLILLCVAVVSCVIGFIFIRKITAIEV
jgi:tight adherence protein B